MAYTVQVINRGGELISPFDVEEIFQQHPAIQEVCVHTCFTCASFISLNKCQNVIKNSLSCIDVRIELLKWKHYLPKHC